MNQILWSPEKSKHASGKLLKYFIEKTNNVRKICLEDARALYDWSIQNPEDFWLTFLDFSQIKLTSRQGPVLTDPDAMPGARWFPDCTLNFAENLLAPAFASPTKRALIFRSEDKVARELTYGELLQQTNTIAHYLKNIGLEQGERVAAVTPNCSEAVIAMLATTSQGGVWSSCSPDFGVSGILDRFGQIDPRVLVVADGYYYKGKFISILPKIKEIIAALPSVDSVIVFSIDPGQTPEVPFTATLWSSLPTPTTELSFLPVPFNHPLYILFSSGTTGKPKCIVHGTGGTLLEHSKELKLHTDISDEDIFFYATTCGWMMWNWLVSGLSCGATLVLYDGFPLLHDGRILFQIAEETGMTVFGTSAGYLSAVQKSGLLPGKEFDLSRLRALLSTGSVLPPESFDFVYNSIAEDIVLSSVSGGTDIVGCFALGCPTLPVRRGELQTRSFGYAVAVYNEAGESIVGEKGELVCSAPFPSMPVMFWNDANDVRYKKAYFDKFPGVWHHGDYVELTAEGGMIFFGRSDAILNPGGVRIGTAEIYRELEQFKEIVSAVVVGRQVADDEEVVLFIKCSPSEVFDETLVAKIKQTIRQNASPRHVPARILQVADIPITRSGKISEVTVKKLIHGEAIENKEALANPESLALFSPLLFK